MTPTDEAWTEGFKAGLQHAIEIVLAEERQQWENDRTARVVCAQVVAQRMGVVRRVIEGFKERA